MCSNVKDKMELVVLKMSDYLQLIRTAEMKGEIKSSMIKTSDLIFLAEVMKELNANYQSELSIINDTVTIHVYKDDETEIKSMFDLKLCERYYNKVNKFISEVL